MRKFFIVKGKKGRLVGDPARPHGFIGQRPIARVPGKDGKVPPLAKKPGDRFEPCLAVIPKHRETRKPLLRGSLDVLQAFEAENFAAAVKVLNDSPQMKAQTEDDKKKAESAKKERGEDKAKAKAEAEAKAKAKAKVEAEAKAKAEAEAKAKENEENSK
jgi:hypothetical protein